MEPEGRKVEDFAWEQSYDEGFTGGVGGEVTRVDC
jgi:hypothetical protein